MNALTESRIECQLQCETVVMLLYARVCTQGLTSTGVDFVRLPQNQIGDLNRMADIICTFVIPISVHPRSNCATLQLFAKAYLIIVLFFGWFNIINTSIGFIGCNLSEKSWAYTVNVIARMLWSHVSGLLKSQWERRVFT